MKVPFYEGYASASNARSIIIGTLDKKASIFQGVAHVNGSDIRSWIYIQPLRKYDKSAAAHDMIVYLAGDRVRQRSPETYESDLLLARTPLRRFNTYPQRAAWPSPEFRVDLTPSNSDFAYRGVCLVEVLADSNFVEAICPRDPAECFAQMLLMIRSADTFFRNYDIGIQTLLLRLLDVTDDPMLDVPTTVDGITTGEKTGSALSSLYQYVTYFLYLSFARARAPLEKSKHKNNPHRHFLTGVRSLN